MSKDPQVSIGRTLVTIREKDIRNALKAWGDALISISNAYEVKGTNGPVAVLSRPKGSVRPLCFRKRQDFSREQVTSTS